MKRFLLLGIAEAALLSLLGWSGAGTPFPTVPVFALAFVVYLVAWRTLDRAEMSSGIVMSPRMTMGWIVGLAVVMRLALLPLEPALSDDVYRYLWDGHVQLAGIDPYLYAPNAPEVEHLRTAWHALINNPGVPTIYPPVAQYAFALIAVLGSSIIAAKLLWLTLDLACAWMLIRVAQRSGRNPRVVGLLYLWSPLLVVETAWSGHLEPLGLAGMAAVLLASLAGAAADGASPRAGRVGAALAVAALAKFAPLAAAPALLRRYGLRFAVVAAGVLALGYLPYVSAGSSLWTGLTTYAEHWRFNAGAFVVLDWMFSGPLAPRWAAAGVVLGVVGWTVLRSMDAEQALMWVVGAGIVLSPTVHPWYVLWMLPFAALRQNPAWLYLSGAVFLGYWGLDAFRETSVWPEPAGIRVLIWIPFFLLLLWHTGTKQLARVRRARQAL